MSITLSPEVEAKLRDLAEKRGVDIEVYANALMNSVIEVDRQEYDETVTAIEEAMEDVREGRVRPYSEFIREHRARYPDPQA
jgi:predicted transcriptional regulator